ncbi:MULTISPECIES: hypothetical protein [Roseococcus]|uniref:hypothetical protein n=1 Tax=Roseococcus TaxID=35812 RepID=UPI00168AAA83|nr:MULTISPECIES: hypothetical protein [Roseococcus]
MRAMLFGLALALAPSLAFAQLYDSGWRRVASSDLEHLDLSGGGMRVNNFMVYAEERAGRASPAEDALRTHLFTVSATRQDEAAREVFVQIVGAREDGTPTVSAAARANFSPRGGNRMQALRTQTPTSESEMGQTQSYFIRVIVQ